MLISHQCGFFSGMVLCQDSLFVCFEAPNLHLGLLNMSSSVGWDGNIDITAQTRPFKHASSHYFLWSIAHSGDGLSLLPKQDAPRFL